MLNYKHHRSVLVKLYCSHRGLTVDNVECTDRYHFEISFNKLDVPKNSDV